MKTNDSGILNETFLGEVNSYRGKLEPVLEADNVLCEEIEMGEMLHPEKVIHTLIVLKLRKLSEIVEKILGKKPNEMSDKDEENFNTLMLSKENSKKLEKITCLSKNIQALQRTLNTVIQARLPMDLKIGQNIGIRPGYKIVVGYEAPSYILNFFSKVR